MNDWNIQARAHGCQGCGKGFADKQPYHTLLLEDKELFRRLDVCGACWESQYREGTSDRKGFISCWQGTYQAPPPRPPEAIQKENAETLLRKIIERNDPQYLAVAYILAVMLERKRQLKIKEQIKQDGKRTFIYEQPHTGDLFTIPDPDLQLDQLEQVQHDVAALLEHGFEPPPAPPTPAEATPPQSPASPEAPAQTPEQGQAPAATASAPASAPSPAQTQTPVENHAV